MDGTSTKPYLIRALHEWCADNGYTPYISIAVNDQTRVPASFVKDGQITLNISAEATQQLTISNAAIDFAARFGGVPMNIHVPIDQVLAIYSRENGVGMGFSVAQAAGVMESISPESDEAGHAEREHGNQDEVRSDAVPTTNKPSRRGKATLKRIK